MKYQHILLATDFAADCYRVAHKTRELATTFSARLSLLSVVESSPEYSIGYMMLPDIEQKMVDETKSQLQTLGAELQVPQEHQYVTVGSPRYQILDVAKELGVDLIVVGSHGRHGLALLLGSTSGSVLHGATCDVLVIRNPQ